LKLQQLCGIYTDILNRTDQPSDVQELLTCELRDPRRQAGARSAIFRTWQLSYEQIRQDNPKAAEMLSLMAVLNNQAIPRMLLAHDAKFSITEEAAIQILLDFSLIKADESYQFFSMHPLQQLVSHCHLLPSCIDPPHIKLRLSYLSNQFHIVHPELAQN
jgi:hypothetical protein